MKKLIPMNDIPQFRNVIKGITDTSRFSGMDTDGNPIFNNNKLPVLKATGTIKLHGTNGSVCYNLIDGLWTQSKNNITNPLKDNAGFACFVEKNKDIFLKLINEVITLKEIDPVQNTIAIFGEWAGKGIQSGIGVSQLEKAFYIFGIKIAPFNEEEKSYWIDSNILDIDYLGIYNIQNFKTFEIDIDFNEPMLSNNKMVEMVLEVENECPVAKYFGISGIGEGIVFEIKYKDNAFRFKMKGEKHAGKSKIKKSKKVDDVKLQKIIGIVEQVTPEWRLSQMYDETFDVLNGGKGEIERTGDFIRNVIGDIMKEELDIILEAELIPKEINSRISKIAREYLMIRLDEEAGLK